MPEDVNLFEAIDDSASNDAAELIKAALNLAWDATRSETSTMSFNGTFDAGQQALLRSYKDATPVTATGKSFGDTDATAQAVVVNMVSRGASNMVSRNPGT